ncbi:Glycerophosphodiester phosphodiesterase [Enterococcus hirae]|uniref:glycerophosphodiester phosphodiesterase n=1 Tax=Enterococcus hirae TaxID=1354 RepID=UPI001959C837|nr:glycerophosphodiester phosphodiesterase family protein [Enterococcus hirae]VTX77981.1 Glycerophosphodiester phosphodiesterase [Enterococcus hirae]
MVENLRLSAHRGAHNFAPENTIEAYKIAIDLKYGAIELDPRASSDSELFIMHDDTVDRTTNGNGYIANMNSEQIRQFEIDTSNYPEYKNKILRVPTFEESVKIISTGNVILNVDGSKIDFSNTVITKKMINILKKYEMYQNTFFVISNTSQRYAFNQSYPDAALSWLLTDSSRIDNAITEVKSYHKALLSIPLNIVTDDILEKLRNTNIYYQIYNVNTKTDLDHLLIKKTPMIETDILLP